MTRRSTRVTRQGTPYLSLLRDPDKAPLTGLPDMWPIPTAVNRLTARNYLVTDADGKAPMFVRPSQADGVIRVGSEVAGTITWGSATAYVDSATVLQSTYSNWRPLCSRAVFSYVGPHGDNEKGILYVTKTALPASATSLTFASDITSAGAMVQAFPVGTSFSVDIYPTSENGASTWAHTSSNDGAGGVWQASDEWEILYVWLDSGAATTAYYVVDVFTPAEFTVRVSSNQVVPAVTHKHDPRDLNLGARFVEVTNAVGSWVHSTIQKTAYNALDYGMATAANYLTDSLTRRQLRGQPSRLALLDGDL